MSESLGPIAEKALRGCATHVAPFIGMELVVADVAISTSPTVPEGKLALLPLATARGDAQLTLGSPLDEIAMLARHMLSAPDPDKVRELSGEELDAVGEILNLMSGAVDQVLQEQLGPRGHVRPLRWWRSDDPGSNRLPEGEATQANASIQLPNGAKVGVWLRIPTRLTAAPEQVAPSVEGRRALLLGLDAALQAAFEAALGRLELAVELHEPGSEAFAEALEHTDLIVLSADTPEGIALCRSLRLDNASWRIPVVACLAEPTRSSVTACVDAGASHVLAVPADEAQIDRILQRARGAQA
jgi:CheY-like chemotaxis protein